MYDTIIIGAGMSGLAAGIRLAHFQHRVCILERHTNIGGLNSIYRLAGHNFDVGLHALTNYVPRGTKSGPLARILRQLRLSWDDLPLSPQAGSAIAFPGVKLRFGNDFELLVSEVHRAFPGQQDGLRRLAAELAGYDDAGQARWRCSARERVAGYLTDPLLREMLLCPLLFYGGPREHDLDFDEFSILFRSVFLEGFGRPAAGARSLLKLLAGKYKDAGGELRLGCGVCELEAEGPRVQQAVLDDGTRLCARRWLSSAGARETMRLCHPAPPTLPPPGYMSVAESISLVDRPPAELGLPEALLFFNDSQRFDYRPPDDLVDVRSGIVCVPNNYLYPQPLPDNVVRVTGLADYDRWAQLDPPAYRAAKADCYGRLVASAERFAGAFAHAVIAHDMFTPRSIRRFTGHEGGAVYGSPEKHFDGATHLENLHLCGSDQGLVGIVGTLMSGVTVANKLLK